MRRVGRGKALYYNNHLRAEHLKSKHLTFLSGFQNHVIRLTIWIPGICGHKTDILLSGFQTAIIVQMFQLILDQVLDVKLLVTLSRTFK